MANENDYKIIVLAEVFSLSAGIAGKKIAIKEIRNNLHQWIPELIEGGFVSNIQAGYLLATPKPEKPDQCDSTENIREISITNNGIEFYKKSLVPPEKNRT